MTTNKMENYYAKVDDKFIKGVTLYYYSTDGILYYESAHANAVSKDELIALFKRGDVIVYDGTNYVRPTTLTISTAYASVAHITVGTSNIAVLTSFYSDGYTAG